jgi:hypothetical protein
MFRDGQVVTDRPVREQRLAEDELVAWDSLRAERADDGPSAEPSAGPA